jgi:hypothetical protein
MNKPTGPLTYTIIKGADADSVEFIVGTIAAILFLIGLVIAIATEIL